MEACQRREDFSEEEEEAFEVGVPRSGEQTLKRDQGRLRWGCLERGQAPEGGGSAADGAGGLDEPGPFSSCSWQPPEAPPPSPRTAKGAGQQCGFRGTPSPVPSCAGPAVGTVPQRE